MSYVLLAIGCWLGIAALVLVFDYLCTRRRLNRLSAKARELGFQFAATGRPFSHTNVRGLTALGEDDSIEVSDLLTGTTESCSMLVFDLPYCSHDAVDVALTTFAAFRCPGGQLPSCHIEVKDLIERVRDAVARKPDLFESDQEFSSHFSVHCSDEAATRAFFNQSRLAHLRTHTHDFQIECSPEWILVYRPAVKVSSDLPEFIRETWTLASALLPKESLELPAA